MGQKQTWAVLAVSAIDDQPSAILAAGKDILDVLEEDRSAEYLTIFPARSGIYLWRGTIEECDNEGLICIGEATHINNIMELNRLMAKNGSVT